VFRHGGAFKEIEPALTRTQEADDADADDDLGFSVGEESVVNEFGEKDLYRVHDADNVGHTNTFPINQEVSARFRLIAYTDASFAVGEKKQSVSGWVVYLNGSPILFGSLKQSVVVDSSCSAEYVAASICVKQLKGLEQMLQFLEVLCHKPYTVYTDSTACKFIADRPGKLGKVRHLSIRTHLVRCYISLGDIELVWCTTETMVADVMTKIVSTAQERNLHLRFYCLLA
jgi:hypothetical protein